MPIASVSNNAASSVAALPAAPRDARIRQTSVDIEDQTAERQRNNLRQVEIIQPSDEVERVTAVNRDTETAFRAIPSFDQLPSSSREALQTYLVNAQSEAASTADGSELIVGVDTFV